MKERNQEFQSAIQYLKQSLKLHKSEINSYKLQAILSFNAPLILPRMQFIFGKNKWIKGNMLLKCVSVIRSEYLR